MSTKYQPIHKERFTIEQTSRGELIRVKSQRQIPLMLFLPIWLTMWSIGGGIAINSLFTDFQLFVVAWLCGWAIGWVAVAGTLIWMFAGSETIAVNGSDIEIAHQALGLSRRWLYQGSQIQNLSVAPQPGWPLQSRWQVPFVRTMRNGSMKFDYGPRTIYAAAGLDEGEARLIVDRIMRKLPNKSSSR